MARRGREGVFEEYERAPLSVVVREGYGPHPEELAKQASRRMDATQGLAAILRDARKGRAPQDEVGDIFTASFAGTTRSIN